ncbi:MAG TPA: hypothetical protein VLK33_13000, partial [Terriglobales bacterium]|nr:hypothetical protein [Terriglobales bacterium]
MKSLLNNAVINVARGFAGASLSLLLTLTIPAAAQHYNRVDLTSDQGVVAPALTDGSNPMNYDPN